MVSRLKAVRYVLTAMIGVTIEKLVRLNKSLLMLQIDCTEY